MTVSESRTHASSSTMKTLGLSAFIYRLLIGRRQRKMKHGARLRARFDPHLAIATFDDRAAHREAHADAADLGGGERLKEARDDFRIDARPRIAHRDQHPSVVEQSRGDPHFTD